MSTMPKMSSKTSNSATSTLFTISKMSSTHNLFYKKNKNNQLEAIKVSELIEELQKCDPNAEVWLPNVNEFGIRGYCVLDHLMTMTFSEIEDDVMNNPGTIDNRLLKNKKDDDQIVYLGSIADFIAKGLDKSTEKR